MVKKLGKQTKKLDELVKKQNELFTKHFTTTEDKFNKKSSTSTKQSSSNYQSGSKASSSSASGNKKTWLRIKRKRPTKTATNSPKSTRLTINQIKVSEKKSRKLATTDSSPTPLAPLFYDRQFREPLSHG